MCSQCVENYFHGLPEAGILHSDPNQVFCKRRQGSRERRWFITDLTVSMWSDMFWDLGSELNANATPSTKRKTSMHTSGLIEINQPS